MKIYNEAITTELESPDLTLGRLESARRLVAHHPEQQREIHYEVMEGSVTEDFPNGQRQEIVDKEYREDWDEYEDVQRYVPFTEAELAEESEKAEREAAMRKAGEEAKSKADAEAAVKAEQEAKIANIDAIEAQTTYTAMMTDTLMEEDA